MGGTLAVDVSVHPGKSEGVAWPRRAQWRAWVRKSRAFLPCIRSVAMTVRMRAMK